MSITASTRRLIAVLVVMALVALGSIVLGAPAARAVDGSVSGAVYEDFDDDGTRDAASSDFSGDAPLAGVTVTATDASGAVRGTAVTRADGSFAIAITGAVGSDVRVEIAPPAGYRPARVGAQNASTVQFVQLGASGVQAGLTRAGMVLPSDGSAPFVTVPSQRGVYSTTGTGRAVTENFGQQPALLGMPYTSEGAPATSGRTTLAVQSQLGSVWGQAAYGSSIALSSAYFRRGAPLGPGGLGAISWTDVTAARAGTPNATTLVTIPNVGADPRGNPVPADYDWLHDPVGFTQTGRIGLGDIELSTDQRTLYAVNLTDRSLYSVPLSPGATATSAPIAGTPTPTALPLGLPGAARGCADANVRPFGLGVLGDDVYVTLTCVGPTAADLRSYVYVLDGATGAFSSAPVMEGALSYPRASTGSARLAGGGEFAPWSDAFGLPAIGTQQAPQPLASTIAFDSAGNAQLSILDRGAAQHGQSLPDPFKPADTSAYYAIFSGGELLRYCGSPAAGWTRESNGSCGGATGRYPGSYGPGGGIFYDNRFTTGYSHSHIMLGSALQLPGYSTVMATVFDPTALFEAGFHTMSNANGSVVREGVLERVSTEPRSGTFAKAGGLGDLAALIALAPVELGDRVWLDVDADGQQDADEAPIPGATVRLYAADGTTLLATAVTDAQGRYVFSSAADASSPAFRYGVPLVADADYVIRLDEAADYGPSGPLAGLVATTPTSGSATTDSDGVRASPVLTTAVVRTPAAGAADHTFDIGFTRSLSLGSRLWRDEGAVPDGGADAGDGVRDPGEGPVVGAVVELLDGAGQPVLSDGLPVTTTTDADGSYRFDGLAPGEYRVRVAPSAFAPGGPLEGYRSSTGVSTDADTASNDVDKGVDAGDPAVEGVTSSPVVLGPGLQPLGEPDVTGSGAGAHGPNGDAFDTLTVDLGFVQPIDLVLEKAPTSGPGPFRLGDVVGFSLTVTNLGPGDASAGLVVTDRIPAGLELVGAAGDAWVVPADLSGPEVSFTYAGPVLAAGASSVLQVEARIASVDAGTLRNVAVVEPAPGSSTPEAIPVGSAPDRFEDGSNVPSATAPSNNDDSADVPVVEPPLSLGNRLWLDTGAGTTNDGVLDDGERPVVGALVELLDAAGAPVLGADGAPRTAVTDADGFYRFDDLPRGTYLVRVAASGFAPGGPLEGLLSSAGATSSFASASNGRDHGVDAARPFGDGVVSGPIDLAPGVADDVDAGAQGAGGHGPFGDAFDTLTADFGFVPGLSLGNRLWFDTGTGAGEANDGSFDVGEAPVAGAVVELLDAAGAPVLGADGAPRTTTSDADGFYRFDGLAPGDYRVRVAAASFGPGGVLEGWFSSTPTSTGFDAASNNDDKGEAAADPATTGVTSGVVTLGFANALDDVDPGAEGAGGNGPGGDAADRLTVDFGFTQAFSIGDVVWIDADGDGIQDAGEQPIAGVTVTLLQADGSPAVDLQGAPVAPAVTDAAGRYLFDGLAPGGYRVQLTNLPAGTVPTRPAAGDDAAVDSNVDATGLTPVFEVGPGAAETRPVQPGDGTAIARWIDPTIDAGIVPLLAIGDVVWIDADRDGMQDADEPPVAGVTVTLLQADGSPALDASGQPVAPAITDAAGRYRFDGLRPGDYRIQFSTLPAGYAPTLPAAPGSQGDDDSNADASGLTPVFTLAEGDGTRPVESGDGVTLARSIDPTIDLGIALQLYAVGDVVWLDRDRDGVQDDGEPPVPGLTVTLLRVDGTPATDWTGAVVAPAVTDASGRYVFDGLLPGEYVIEFSGVPAGYRFTSQGQGGGGAGGDADSDPDALGRTPAFTIGPDAAGTRAVVGSDGVRFAVGIDPTIDAGLVEIDEVSPSASAVPPSAPAPTTAAPSAAPSARADLPATGGTPFVGVLAVALLLLAAGVATRVGGRRVQG